MGDNAFQLASRFVLEVAPVDDEDDSAVAYLRLPTHPGGVCKMSRSVRLTELMGPYEGPEVVLDFDARGVLVGLEVLA